MDLFENLSGSNSIEEVLDGNAVSKINAGLNDAWYNPETSGQGFFITVFSDMGAVSLAWFTYDTELPPDDAVAPGFTVTEMTKDMDREFDSRYDV